jgi:hypothetical protein
MVGVMKMIGALLLGVALVAFIAFAVFFIPGDGNGAGRCQGMPKGHQSDLCKDFAKTHPEETVPAVPPDRQPLTNIEGEPR